MPQGSMRSAFENISIEDKIIAEQLYIYIYIYIYIHTNKKEIRKTVGFITSTEKGHGTKQWKEAEVLEYYNII